MNKANFSLSYVLLTETISGFIKKTKKLQGNSTKKFLQCILLPSLLRKHNSGTFKLFVFLFLMILLFFFMNASLRILIFQGPHHTTAMQEWQCFSLVTTFFLLSSKNTMWSFQLLPYRSHPVRNNKQLFLTHSLCDICGFSLHTPFI